MKFINSKRKEQSYETIEDLFTTERNVRNDLFGSYLGENKSPIPSVVLEKVDEKMATYKRHLNNLNTLREVVAVLAADDEAKKLQGTVDDMSNEEAERLMKQLKAKLGLWVQEQQL